MCPAFTSRTSCVERSITARHIVTKRSSQPAPQKPLLSRFMAAAGSGSLTSV